MNNRRVAFIRRYKHDGTRSGLATGRHAQWNYRYEVLCVPFRETQAAFTLREARDFASHSYHGGFSAERTVELFDGGKVFERGPRGGMRKVLS